MIKSYLHLLAALSALLFQALPAAFIYLTPSLFYGKYSMLPESWLWSISVSWIVVFAICGLTLSSTASYLLLTRSSRLVAGVMIGIFCVPSWLLSAFYLQASLVFLAAI